MGCSWFAGDAWTDGWYEWFGAFPYARRGSRMGVYLVLAGESFLCGEFFLGAFVCIFLM